MAKIISQLINMKGFKFGNSKITANTGKKITLKHLKQFNRKMFEVLNEIVIKALLV